jgi:hypothetical protein
MLNNAIYIGNLTHHRFLPKIHRFQYGVALFLLDLDFASKLFRIPKLFGFHREDYLRDDSQQNETLKETVTRLILERTNVNFKGKIKILTQIRYFGFCFNPVSFYYCFNEKNEKLEFIVAEISNTPWNERKVYVLNCTHEKDGWEKFEFMKNFHVSPFMQMDLLWKWNFSIPSQTQNQITVHMEDWTIDRKDHYFNATLIAKPKPLTFSNLLILFLTFPLLTLKPFIAIYYEALIIKLKNIPFYDHPVQEKQI